MKEAASGPLSQDQESLRRVEILIARVLFWGSLVSVAIALAGLTLYFSQQNVDKGDLVREFAQQSGSNPHVFTSVGSIVQTASASLNPLAIMGIGLLLLLTIPVLTVTLTIIAFFRERDYRYAVISTVVLLILLVSFLVGA